MEHYEVTDSSQFLTKKSFIATDMHVYNLKDYKVLQEAIKSGMLKITGKIVFKDLIYALHDDSDTLIVAPRKILETSNDDLNELYNAINPSQEELFKLIEEDTMQAKKWIKEAILKNELMVDYDFYLKVEIE
jgi:hypothetical protein